MINDYFDTPNGVDTAGYVRALYAPHPILSGWVTKRQLAAAILIVNVIDARSCSTSPSVRGPLILVFALAGLFVSVFYVAPPIRLKHHGLGEPGRVPRLGSADGRRDVPRGDRDRSRRGSCVASIPYALHRDRRSCSASTSTRSRRTRSIGVRTLPGHPGRGPGADRRLVADDRVLPADDPVGGGRLVGPWVLLVVLGIPRLLSVLKVFAAAQAARRRRPAIRSAAGRCGSSATPSSIPAAPAACSPSACCSTRWCRSRLPWL